MRTDIDPDAICVCTKYKTCMVGRKENPSKGRRRRTEEQTAKLDQNFGIDRCNLMYGIKFKCLDAMRKGIVNKISSRTCCWGERYRVQTLDWGE
jgi:hypothetical protein